MNQALATRPETSINAVGISSGMGGSKIAPQNLGEVVRFAEVMSKADLALPKHLRGNAGACMAVALQALEWQMSPFAVASKSYAVNGAIAYEAQLIAAVVNTRSGIKGRLKYEYTGEAELLQCTVTGTLDGEDYSYTSPPMRDITPKNSPLWKTDPKQQLGYYSARSWARRHTPEVILGVYDRDEAEQFRGPENAKDVTPLSARLEQARTGSNQTEDEREGFDAAHVARETETRVSEAEFEELQSGEHDAPDASDEPPAGAEGDGVSSPRPSPSPLIECCRKLLGIAVDPLFETAQQRRTALEKSKDEWKAILPEDDHRMLRSIVSSADAVIKGDTSHESAVLFFSECLECSEDDLK